MLENLELIKAFNWQNSVDFSLKCQEQMIFKSNLTMQIVSFYANLLIKITIYTTGK